MNQILVVDDEVGIRELLSDILGDEGYQVRLAENAEQARNARSQQRPDLVLLDIWMPDTDGVTLLKEWAANGLLTMPVVMMSGHGTIDTAVEATRIGAYDFLEKPVALQKLLATVNRALRHSEPRTMQLMSLAALGKAPVINELKQRLERVSHLGKPVLLIGEPGVGLEYCAHFLHRSNTPWIEAKNLAMLVDRPLDLLQQAHEGVLFIPEIGELSKLEQKGLLFLLDKCEKYNARLVCATSQDLPQLTAQSEFDPRLFQELNEIVLRVPSLREHREDIPELAKIFLLHSIEAKELPGRQFSTAALNAMRNYDWPGNLAQLKGAVKTLALTAATEEISLDEVERVLSQFDVLTPLAGVELPLHLPLRDARDAFEKMYFEYHIAKEHGNISRVAEKAGLERTHLYRKFKQLGISLSKKNEDQIA